MNNINTIAIIINTDIPMITFAAAELQKALTSNHITAIISPMEQTTEADVVNRMFIITLDSVEGKRMLQELNITLPELRDQGYAIIKNQSSKANITTWHIIGADSIGAMYGTLEAAVAVKREKSMQAVRVEHKNPHIINRGIKFNIPLDSRTPSYSDASDSARQNIADMWNMAFWQSFLDEMAYNRYNAFSLWNLHPFPSMVKVPEYPDIALQDVKQTTSLEIDADLQGRRMSNPETLANLITVKVMTIEEKISFWQNVMQYAKDRGIDVYLITWNIFTFGTEGNRYGIDDKITNETTKDYFRASVRSLLNTYPLLAGIGVTSGENMMEPVINNANEKWLWSAYGEAIMDVKKNNPDRPIRFIHRAHQTALSEITDAFAAYPDTFDFSFKYSAAHMYSSVKPHYIHDGFLDQLPEGKQTWLTIRDDDYYYFRFGDPEFARQYIVNMPTSDKLAGYYMGPDGYTWGREYVSVEPDSPHQLVIHKKWYSFMLFGKLGYDPTLPDAYFQKELEYRFPEISGEKLYAAWANASKIIPLVNRFHWNGDSLDFQWYPEACFSHKKRSKGFHTVQHFIDDSPMPGNGLMSIPEYCDSFISGSPMREFTPLQVAEDLNRNASSVLSLISDMKDISNKELRQTIGDLAAMSSLGHYYACKILGASALCLYRKTNLSEWRKQAVDHLSEASLHWSAYADMTHNQYVPQVLTRLGMLPIDLHKLQVEVDYDVEIAKHSSPSDFETRCASVNGEVKLC